MMDVEGDHGEDLLFVYGTLRTGFANEASRLLATKAERVGEARIRGRLYLVSWFPGAVPSDDPTDQIVGEVYRLRDPKHDWPALDRYEGADEGRTPPLFVRRRVEVTMADGDRRVAWTYFYVRSTHEYTRIESGDFASFLKQCGS